MTYQFLKQQGTKNIPLVEAMHQYGKSGDPFQFTVMSRAKGVPLQSVWHGLSSEERKGYAEQVTAALRELRKFTSPVPRRVDGSPLWDNIIGRCYVSKKCQNIKNTTEEWLGSIDEELRFGIARSYRTLDKDFIEAKLKELKADFPDGAPYVLTHGDLHFENIIVNNGKIEAIIDWETAGYYPWWFERFASLNRVYSSGAGELFGTVWAELDPDHDPKQFKDKVSNHVRPLESAYYFCLLEHTEDLDVWRRPAFCECKPYGGVIYRRDWDAELEHKIDYKGEKQKIIL
ncbi:kinase-like protein [Amniculicola lignicola CBS 123094]|uniref:Kinase-like protein n=1 Tax=Amniculicola lignicola CBS 123094 TaxID=1392246 RepID=A0A6A5X3C9_9PLEO|nr:kinase-like protein [Amniculicola lignicola CBS 123094]